MRTLFVLPDLGVATLRAPDALSGQVALSGSRAAWLIVTEGLARAGVDVASVVMSGDEAVETEAPILPSLDEALAWAEGGRVVCCSWGDLDAVNQIVARGIRPWVWLHTHLNREFLDTLDRGEVEAIVVPSDSARLHALRRRTASRIGSAYNPLHPAFVGGQTGGDERYARERVVFAGALTENKGAHRVLSIWPRVREQRPDATLLIAGSPKLYDASHQLGPLGVALADFEAAYVQPLVDRFGSLADAGVEFLGLMSPANLRDLYGSASLGIANLNWTSSVETFGCAIAEMIATGLPVVGYARGALPETAGQTGAAELLTENDDERLAYRVIELLSDPQRLQRMATHGQEWVLREYDAERVVDGWRRLLAGDADRCAAASGPWRMPGQKVRYAVERTAGRIGCGSVLDRLEHSLAAARGG